MRRRTRAIVAVVATVLLAVPFGARSVPIVSPIAQCQQVAEVGGGEHTCTTTFILTDARFPSKLETHANFHARTARGTVTLEWYDQLLKLQARFVCDSPGLYVTSQTPTGDTVGGGPADLSSYPTCRQTVNNSAYFARGLQTLVVRATAHECWANDNGRTRCPYHGYLVLERPGWPL